MSAREFKLRDKVSMPNAGPFGMASHRWVYQADSTNGSRTQVDPHITITITPAEFDSRGRPGTLYVQITTEKPEENEDDDQPQ